MKRISVFCLLLISCMIINAQDYFMYVGGKKRYLKISPNKIIVQFDEKTAVDSVKNVLQKNTSWQLSDVSATDNKGLNLISFSNTDKTAVINLVNQWKNRDEILYSGHVFIDSQGKETAAMTNRIIIRLKEEDDYSILQNAVKPYDIKKIERDEFDSRTYLLSLNYTSKKNAMQIANEMYEKGLFEYAEPDLLLFINYGTNDVYFPQQWALENTGQYGDISGIDIKASQAWNITTGSPNIKIAILDSGIDLTHPDLVNNLLPGYDATGGNNNGDQSGNGHGTSCAGIVAACGNNNIGVAGVAYNCRILPIHMGESPLASYVANGLNWARQNGARIISMSFSADETNAVNTALYEAASSECVLIAVSGNRNYSGVFYPACLPNVIAVGAISPCGERKSIDSCDGETWWGSNYGDQLDIVAPGVNISTTDIQGDGGYNYYTSDPYKRAYSDYSSKDYTKWFNGTSAACPHVAGVAALILSVNPSLTAQQVRDIIENTAQKIRPDLYDYQISSEHPNGTWNNEVGYGLVNAYNAVRQANGSMLLLSHKIFDYGGYYATACDNVEIEDVIVRDNARLHVKAGQRVVIRPPFRATPSDDGWFWAQIAPCSQSSPSLRSSLSDNAEYADLSPTAISEVENRSAYLAQNTPNPATDQTLIRYYIPETFQSAEILISSITGVPVKKMPVSTSGYGELIFNVSGLSSGIYLYSLKVDGRLIDTKRMCIQK